MSWSKKSTPPGDSEQLRPKPALEKVEAGAWKSTGEPVRRSFPGPKNAAALLRVAVQRSAYAELIAHAKESLDKEICGVLAGTVCRDDDGSFVQVDAIIRGNSANQGSTHVTFTHETWSQIHQQLEKQFPKLNIVGWYHSHPGFGVEFSEMDVFIQKNFFSGDAQIALVLDPLSGAVAICLNTAKGIEYLERFWVDGREQPCQSPKAKAPAPGSVAAPPGDIEAALRALEARVGQLVQALDEQRASYYRFLLFVGMAVCAGVVLWLGYSFYSAYRYRNEPPRLTQFMPVPVQVGNKSVLMGVAVAEWQVPEELNATLIAVERERQALADKAKLEETNKTNAASAPTNTVAPPKP